MSEEMDDGLLQLTLGAEFDRAPVWARALALQQRKDRHHFAGELGKLSAEQGRTTAALGREPDSDGHGGAGLIGDVRRMNRDLGRLMDLRKMGAGAIGALTLFGALIILGVTHFIQSVSGAAPK